MPRPRFRNAGVTLVELMVTVAVLAVLLALAAPSFASFIVGTRLASQANELVAAANLARTEAIKRGVPVSVASISTTNAWQAGWRVATALEVIRSYGALTGTHTLQGSAASIRYLPAGFPEGPVALLLCPATGSEGRSINIAASGRVTVAQAVCNAG